MDKIKLFGKKALDCSLWPLTYVAAKWYKFIISKGIMFFPISKATFMRVGVLPVIDQYYSPMINPKKHIRKSLRENRELPGINLNDSVQLALLSEFNYNEELKSFSYNQRGDNEYYYDNGMFGPGDSEIQYSMIRHFKPRRIIEIGSGNSTLMAINAVAANKKEDSNYHCDIHCIEPYQMPWLEKLDIKLNRELVENIELSWFDQLEENDILFIDSSHIIRPQGDVLYEFLQLLPRLKKGVIIHIHDIFTPKDYLDAWIFDALRIYDEQYLLEALLTDSNKYEIISALNYLFHEHKEALLKCCPVLAEHPDLEPRSFWIKKSL